VYDLSIERREDGQTFGDGRLAVGGQANGLELAGCGCLAFDLGVLALGCGESRSEEAVQR